MTILCTGNVGIGTTTPAANAKLQVIGDIAVGDVTPSAAVSAVWLANDDGDSANTFRLDGYSDDIQFIAYSDTGAATGTNITFATGTAGAGSPERMRIDSNGNVGIGTTVPSDLLHIKAPSGATSISLDNVAGQYCTLRFKNNGTNEWHIIKDSSNRFKMVETGVETRMTLYPGGNVGIGDESPDSHLEVSADGTTGGNVFTISSDDGNDGDILTIKEDGNVGIGTTVPGAPLSFSSNVEEKIRLLGSQYGFGIHNYELDIFANQHVAFRDNSYSGSINAKIAVKGGLASYLNAGGGNVGIGTTNPGHLLELSGGAYCDGTGDWITGSDINYKKDISDLTDYGLDEIMNLRPVRYVHKADEAERVQLGLIAQEVKPVIPEVVDGEDGHMGIGYAKFVPVLINAIKELKAKNDVLEARNAEIMSRLEALETK